MDESTRARIATRAAELERQADALQREAELRLTALRTAAAELRALLAPATEGEA